MHYTRDCPTCGADIDVHIMWHEDSDGDGPWSRSWFRPELASEARCPACDAEPGTDALEAWLDEIAEDGMPAPEGEEAPADVIPY